MEDSDNPYEILGVSSTATASEIKTAYRKLALKHHPDRQTNESAKASSGPIFAKISNAYEILGDDRRRQEYDQQKRREGMRSSAFNDHNFHFHDPFQVFAQTFAREFGTQQRGGAGDGFHDSFFGSPFGGGLFGGMFDRQNGFQDPFSDPFFQDPFSSHRSMGGRHTDIFSQMQQQMDMMRQQNPSSSPHFYSSSSSSSSFRSGGNQRESVSTTTRIINGKRQTITERVITKPDGTVERHVETDGDPDFPAQLEQGPVNGLAPRPLLEEKPKRQKTKKFFR
jgi:curved DNA-binding protein CbpA